MTLAALIGKSSLVCWILGKRRFQRNHLTVIQDECLDRSDDHQLFYFELSSILAGYLVLYPATIRGRLNGNTGVNPEQFPLL